MTDPELVARSGKRAKEREQRFTTGLKNGTARKRLHSTVGYRSPDDFENEEKRIAALSLP
jgi:hypothetical protein